MINVWNNNSQWSPKGNYLCEREIYKKKSMTRFLLPFQ